MSHEEEFEELLPEVPNTPELEEALWQLHMEEDDVTVPQLSKNGLALLEILSWEVDVEETEEVVSALREVANYLEYRRLIDPDWYS